MNLSNYDFLNWIAGRLVRVHGEDPNVDFVLSLRERAVAARASEDWQPMDTAPRDGTPILVLLETKELCSRAHVAVIHPNITTVGGNFEFDMPKMIGWRPILGVPA